LPPLVTANAKREPDMAKPSGLRKKYKLGFNNKQEIRFLLLATAKPVTGRDLKL
jgi:hypothetical protein